MSDQTLLSITSQDNLDEIREAISDFAGPVRCLTPKHFTTGPQTFVGQSDIASFDTTGASITINLPPSPVDGDTYEVVKTVAGNTLTVGRNGKTINGVAADDTLTTAYQWKKYTWSVAANTWLMRS